MDETQHVAGAGLSGSAATHSGRPWEKCREHGPAAAGVWACARCLVELRTENERLRVALQEADIIMGHDDAETEWRERWAGLWAQRESGAWVPVTERMPPPGSVVLVAYRNELGHWRRICAEWVPAKTQEANTENEESEYDEAADTYYTPEGWYERINNWDDYSSVKVYEGEPTHWMHLPLPPEGA